MKPVPQLLLLSIASVAHADDPCFEGGYWPKTGPQGWPNAIRDPAPGAPPGKCVTCDPTTIDDDTTSTEDHAHHCLTCEDGFELYPFHAGTCAGLCADPTLHTWLDDHINLEGPGTEACQAGGGGGDDEPTPEPTRAPTETPTTASPTDASTKEPVCVGRCCDDATWFKEKPHKTCAWVAQKSEKRCSKEATKHCKATCPDSTKYKFARDKPEQNCDWVAESPSTRCAMTDFKGRLVSDECAVACGCPSTLPTFQDFGGSFKFDSCSDECSANDCKMPCVTSAEDNQALFDFASAVIDDGEDVWLGYQAPADVDSADPSKYSWAPDCPSTYTNWRAPNPDGDGGFKGGGAEMKMDSDVGDWNDNQKGTKNRCVCQC